MAARTALNAKNLEALGAARLAELLIEISTGNAAAKRRLRLELAGARSPAKLAKEVRIRLAAIARSRSFVHWQGIRSLADDLEAQRRAIAETVAKADPIEPLELLWRFMALAASVFEWCDDSSGRVIGVFREACSNMGEVALEAKVDPTTLADRAFEALVVNDYMSPRPRKVPKIAAEIARRLLSAGRAEEAWQTIEATEHRRRSNGWDWPDFEWEDARIDALDALGRTDDAQAARWACFERSLSASHLCAYLKRLPDFDDLEAEKKALDSAQRARSLLHALSFLAAWPALDRAASLVMQRAAELDGDHYEILTRAAEALAGKYPLAATPVLRAMIDFSLRTGRSTRYRHAARHLLDCSGLSSAIEDFGCFEPHDAYEARLRREHARKSSFWSYVD